MIIFIANCSAISNTYSMEIQMARVQNINMHYNCHTTKTNNVLACSRRSDSGARAKNKASERAGKKRGETGGEDEGTPVKLILKSS